MVSRQTLLVEDDSAPGVSPAGGIAVLERDAIGTLDEREEFVLQMRFGARRASQTHPDVAQRLGVSDETVRRIERQALRKLRLSALGPVGSGWQGWDEV